MGGIASLLSSYSDTRRKKIDSDRQQEDQERNVKLKTYQYSIDHADELGLTEDDLRTIFNDVGKSFGHKPDPKILGLFNAPGADKGSGGKPDLGDMLFPQKRRDATVITGSKEGQPFTPQEQANSPMMENGQPLLQAIGPPPEMLTSRHGEIPVHDLHARQNLEEKQKLAEAQSKGQIQYVYGPDGSLQAGSYDPITKEWTPIKLPEGTKAVSTINKEIGAQATANKDLNTEIGLLKADPQYSSLSDADLQAIASHNVQTKRKADLDKTTARTLELNASTNLKRARTSSILNPKLSPYEAARLGLQKQSLELQAARIGISQGNFDNSISKDLVKNLQSFYTTRNNSLKLIEEGNVARGKKDMVTAASKWRLGYNMLAQAKMQAENLHSQYGEMVNIANTDPGDEGQFPWVEVNFDVPSKQTIKGAGGVGKRPFTPSQTIVPEMIQKYREWLGTKSLTPEQIEAKVKQYASTGQQ